MNKVIVASGGNIGDVISTLKLARIELEQHWGQAEHSDFFSSAAVDYLEQDDFVNQVWCFEKPSCSAKEALDLLLNIEKKFGRERSISRGPRTLDLDLIFFGNETHSDHYLVLPHPRFLQRSFVIRPMLQLSISNWLRSTYEIPDHFSVEAHPILEK